MLRDAFEYPRGRLDLGLWRLENRVLAGTCPGGERGAGVFGRDCLAVPFGQFLCEGVVLRGQVGDPRAGLGNLLPGGEGELVALGLGGWLRFG